jgi:hypothetical protein
MTAKTMLNMQRMMRKLTSLAIEADNLTLTLPNGALVGSLIQGIAYDIEAAILAETRQKWPMK